MSTLAGTGQLVRLVLRRDRVRLPIWILAITAVTAASGDAVRTFYDTPAKVAGYQATVTSSGTSKMMNGRPYATDSIAGIIAYEVTMTALVVAALMSVFLVVRHTRAEEESGRAELLRGTVTGRHAAIWATVLVAAGAALLVGALDAIALVANDLPTWGSLLHGAALSGVGLVFAAVATVTAQVTSSARGALGIAGAVLGAAFVVRGIGDVAENALTWVSPLGWAQAVDPYGDPQAWPLVALGSLVAVLVGAATWLAAHRDAGSGLLHPRPGHPRAHPSLLSSTGLAWRLQRTSLLWWAVGLAVGGSLFGSIGPEVIDMVESNPELMEVLGGGAGGDILDTFFAAITAILAVVAAGFTVASALRLRAEEAAGRAEVLLATGLSRVRWVLGGVAVTVVGTVLTLLAAGLGMGVSYAWASGEGADAVGPLVLAAVAMAPASLTLAAVGVLLLGWWPRAAALSWAVLGFAFLQIYLGELLRFPDWLSSLSPYHHVPRIPEEPFAAVPELALLALAAVVAALGVVGLRRRDVRVM